MGDIAAVAERLRLVRRARRKFLRLWEIDQTLIGPMVERLAADLGATPEGQDPETRHPETQSPAADSPAHNPAPPADES